LPAKKSAAQYWSLRGISVAKLSIYKYVRTDKGWRYCKAAFHPNGKIKPNVVVILILRPASILANDKSLALGF
jgi:hypothetical protein